jgi:signal transduction histidine kinase
MVKYSVTPAPSRFPLFRKNLSLRSQVSLVTAVLVFFTNFGMVSLAFLLDPNPDYDVFHLRVQIAVWLIVMSSATSFIVYIFSRQLLLPLTHLNRQLLEVRGKHLRLEDIESSSSAAEITTLRETLRGLLEQISLEQSRRDAFIAALVHDLKTPLIATGHLLAVIEKDDTLTREERVKLVGSLHVETERLVDPKELERALYNLLTNAVRYARAEISISVSVNCVRISDDGPGLSKPLDELAKPFNGQPTEIGGQRYASGTGGLGLFIAKSILEAHGGRLADESASGKTTLAAYFL